MMIISYMKYHWLKTRKFAIYRPAQTCRWYLEGKQASVVFGHEFWLDHFDEIKLVKLIRCKQETQFLLRPTTIFFTMLGHQS